MKIQELLQKLKNDGNQGADLSPGNPTSKQAYSVIKSLMDHIKECHQCTTLKLNI